MLFILYRILSSIIRLFIRLLPQEHAYRIWLSQRNTDIHKNSTAPHKKNLLILCPSLGEYEMSKGIISQLKSAYNIHLSFFSRSGYDYAKSHEQWNSLSYTPLDRAKEVNDFLNSINPDQILICSNFLWPQLFRNVIKKNIPIHLVEFNPTVKKWYHQAWLLGWKHYLESCQMISTSDQLSYEALTKKLSLKNVVQTQPLRLSTIAQYKEANWEDTLIEQFCKRKQTIVIGSSHPKDIILFKAIYKSIHDQYQLLIVPHHINNEALEHINKCIPDVQKYSETEKIIDRTNALIIDKMGILKYIYRYVHIAYIGGGFDSGIHNSSEAAIYGIPIIFGPRYTKFADARSLIHSGQAISISTSEELKQAIDKISNNPLANKWNVDIDQLNEDISLLSQSINNNRHSN